jgi:ubiquitin-protein ligase
METINSKTEFSNIVEKWNSTNSGLLKINNFDIFGKKINTCISFDNIIIKIMTDLTEFFVISDEMNNEKYDFLNIKLISNFKKKKWVIIFDIIFEFIKKIDDIEKNIISSNPLNIDHPVQERTKEIIDFEKIRKTDKKIRQISVLNNNIPKQLLFDSSKIDNMIETEILNINKNFSHLHSIVPKNSIYTLSIRMRFSKENAKKTFSEIETRYGYDYMEFLLKLDPYMYPFYPPKLEYVKPNINNNIVCIINNLNILTLANWNPTISLDWLIISLADKIEPLIEKIVNVENPLNGNNNYSFNPIEYNLIRLAKETGEIYSNGSDNSITDTISLNYSKVSYKKNKKGKTYWKSGVGYGYDGNSNWDIKSYIKEKEIQEKNISKILNKINEEIKNNISEENRILIEESILPIFIINRFRGTTLIEIEKNILLYNSILDILSVLVSTYKNFSKKITNQIGMFLKPLNDEIEILLNKVDINLDNIYLRIHSLSSTFISNLVETKNEEKEISDNIKEVYINEMKKIQFQYCDKIDTCYYDEKSKQSNSKPSTLKRIIQDISNLKQNLPLTWGSSVFVRCYKDRINCLKFIISGPENTPYENGLFLFHAFFSSTYPDTEPKVILITTGSGSVRFNPNLYNCGKVCLSLLGTWKGKAGESWNKESTFLQVLVSIQSLILVEDPYFNEPGWERQMNTKVGDEKSFIYNDLRRLKTVEFAINEQIENSLNNKSEFSEIIQKHFLMKKEEIRQTVSKWAEESNKYSDEIIQELSKFNSYIKILEDMK